MNKTLVVDIGGTHVKLMIEGADQRAFDSGMRMRPTDFVARVKENTRDWNFENISIGFPSPVRGGQIIRDPKHLGPGWVGFDFGKSLGKPVRVINDAAMQALGSYHDGRMLFLGLGTGLGSALAFENMLFPLELGEEEWKREVIFAVTQLKKSFIADYVVLGGGNVHRFDQLPEGIERGKNENAFLGGLRLWETQTGGERKWQIF